MNRISMTVVILAFAASACCRAADDAEDLKKWEGKWSIESITSRGRTVPADRLKDMTMTIADGKMIVKAGEDTRDEASMKLNLGTNPKQMDMTSSRNTQTKVKLCIYELKDDVLKICSGETRPTEFASKEGSTVDLMVLKRTK